VDFPSQLALGNGKNQSKKTAVASASKGNYSWPPGLGQCDGKIDEKDSRRFKSALRWFHGHCRQSRVRLPKSAGVDRGCDRGRDHVRERGLNSARIVEALGELPRKTPAVEASEPNGREATIGQATTAKATRPAGADDRSHNGRPRTAPPRNEFRNGPTGSRTGSGCERRPPTEPTRRRHDVGGAGHHKGGRAKAVGSTRRLKQRHCRRAPRATAANNWERYGPPRKHDQYASRNFTFHASISGAAFTAPPAHQEGRGQRASGPHRQGAGHRQRAVWPPSNRLTPASAPRAFHLRSSDSRAGRRTP